MSKIGDIFVRLGLKKDDFEKGLQSAERKTQSFGSRVKSALSSTVARFASVTGAILLMGKALKDVVQNIASFERANAVLASVLRTNVKGIQELTQSAKELGRTTEFTASDVTALQTSLARMGFDKRQILDMQNGVLKFASAVGTDLASAADFTGSALRAFGLNASDTTKLLDIMAASTTKSALDFSKLATSISIVAPVAKGFGLTAAETTSFLGVLANNGFEASSAATALRNILLNLADSNGKLAQGIGHSAKSFPEIIDAFQELTERGVKVDEVLGMTDKRAAAAALALISNADAVKQLNTELNNCDGTMNEMYDTMTNNIQGATNNLKSAWEGLTLAFSNSKGIIKDVIQLLADALNRMTAFLEGTTGDFQFKKDVKDMMEGFKDDDYFTFQKRIIEQENKVAEIRRKGLENDAKMAEYYLKVMKQARKEMFGEPGNTSTTTTTTTTTPNVTTPALSDEEKKKIENERKAAEEIAKNSHKAVTDRRTILREAYEKDIADLERFGIDTTERTRQYYKDLVDLAGEHNKEMAKLRAYEPLTGVDVFELDKDMAGWEQSYQAEFDVLFEQIDATYQKLQAQKDLWTDLMEGFRDAIVDGFSDACEELMNQLMGLEEFNPGAVVKILLEPLADMAEKAGAIIMAEGLATIAAKSALETFGATGWGAVAAGAALIAAGAAAKAGLSALAKGGATAAGTSGNGASGSGGNTTQNIETELTITVEGRLSGSDIVLAGQKTLNGWSR